jgi:hypothetical protein
MKNLICFIMLLTSTYAFAQTSTCTVTFSRFSLGFDSIIPVGSQIESSADGQMRFDVIADSNNPYFNVDKNAYLVPGNVKDIEVKVSRDSKSTSGSVPIGYINLLGVSLPGIDTVVNNVDLTNC